VSEAAKVDRYILRFVSSNNLKDEQVMDEPIMVTSLWV
jgi:hypothetical protein